MQSTTFALNKNFYIGFEIMFTYKALPLPSVKILHKFWNYVYILSTTFALSKNYDKENNQKLKP